MTRKFIVSILFAVILFAQTTFSNSSQTVQTSSMLEVAAMLPDSDIVATFDADRMLNIAAPDLLGNDAKKIENLKKLMRTLENQIGLNPYEIKQIALGIKFPAQAKIESLDILEKSDVATIIRTANPNGNLLETWSQRIDVISAFRDEQKPSRKYMDEFKYYRDFKFDKTTPEKIAAVEQKFRDSLSKIQEIDKKLNSLPKATTDAKTIADMRTNNKGISATINDFFKVLKADTDTKPFRETSIKLLNRWNAVTVDDAQRAAKLAVITSESKTIAPAFRQKYENAAKIEKLMSSVEPDPSTTLPNFIDELFTDLSRISEELDSLPGTKIKRTEALQTHYNITSVVNSSLKNNLEQLSPEADAESVEQSEEPVQKPAMSFSKSLQTVKVEEKINGKRMVVIDLQKMDEPIKSEENIAKESTIPIESVKTPTARIAIGFLDERTMVIGFEKTITQFMKRDVNYKNQKAIDMLGNSQNSVMAFAVNSTVVKSIASGSGKTPEKTVSQEIIGSSTLLDKLTDDINVYGSINYDTNGKLTNDITMSLGFYKEKIAGDILPESASSNADPNVDNTFEIAGYQVGKDIFYDLFNSFKAVQASMTVKFEKKRVASLIRSTPRIIEKIKSGKSVPQNNSSTAKKRVPNNLESFQELVTAPQLYVDLAELLGKNLTR